MLKTNPAVFAVGKFYQIIALSGCESMMWVKIGGRCYYDHSNGILRSKKNVHKITVPMAELDKEKKYTLCEREIIERKPYFSETKEVKEYEYDFCPAEGEILKAYHIADAHNLVEEPVKAAKTFGDFDFLILNGDVPNHSGNLENFDNIYEICDALTKGEKPVIFSRGNHDLRGIYAECIEDYTPTDGGKSYFTFTLGTVWGIVLDCGEDKTDRNKEYGNTICCHAFREEETEFIKEVIRNAEREYLKPDIKTRLVICHMPFTEGKNPPFNIEDDLYAEWGRLLRENIKPDAMLSGHNHQLYISYPGDEHDKLGHPCPVIVGSYIAKKENGSDEGTDTPYGGYFAGCGIEITEKSIKGKFTDSDGKTLEEFEIKKNNF